MIRINKSKSDVQKVTSIVKITLITHIFQVKKNLLIEFIKGIFGASEFSLPGLIFSVIHKLNGFVPASKSEKYQALHKSLKKKLLVSIVKQTIF